jgi:hypothetical protein
MWDTAVYSDGRAVVTHPQFLFKQKYLGDYLLIRSARLRDMTVVDQQRWVVYPMFTPSSRPSPDAIRGVTLQSSQLCHCIAVRHFSLPPFFITILEPHAEAGEPGLRVREQHGNLNIEMTADLKRRIEDAIREGVAFNATPAP